MILCNIFDMSRASKEFQAALTAERIADRFAMEHPSAKAKADYLREHPQADPKDHFVVDPRSNASDVTRHPSEEARTKHLRDNMYADPSKHVVDERMNRKPPSLGYKGDWD